MEGNHNAFTDMCEFRGDMYPTFRSCPDGHLMFTSSGSTAMPAAKPGFSLRTRSDRAQAHRRTSIGLHWRINEANTDILRLPTSVSLTGNTIFITKNKDN